MFSISRDLGVTWSAAKYISSPLLLAKSVEFQPTVRGDNNGFVFSLLEDFQRRTYS